MVFKITIIGTSCHGIFFRKLAKVAPSANKAQEVTEFASNFAISSNGFHKVISNKLHAKPESKPMMRGLVNNPYEVLTMTVLIGAFPHFKHDCEKWHHNDTMCADDNEQR